MTSTSEFNIMPYSMIVGQTQLKMALEVAYIAPRIGGVLLSGQRGTGKSTAVRAFAHMMTGKLPVTIPINATEDRVVGGWKIDKLVSEGKADPQPGLLEDADNGLLYVDEINLLDDHIANIILDVTATGILLIHREGRQDEKVVSFTLVGTMNPEEGHLRGQLLDRFGLVVAVKPEQDEATRAKILQTVLAFDREVFLKKQKKATPVLDKARKEDEKIRQALENAQKAFYNVTVPAAVLEKCPVLAKAFEAQGHRADYVMALAAQALAAREGKKEATPDHLRQVAPLALAHRRGQQHLWTKEDSAKLEGLLK